MPIPVSNFVLENLANSFCNSSRSKFMHILNSEKTSRNNRKEQSHK